MSEIDHTPAQSETSHTSTQAPTLFRKKPIVVEAWRFEGQPEHEWPVWLRWHPFTTWVTVASGDIQEIHVRTLEGVMTARKGDWIIRGVEGELYPCKPSVFESSYEPA